MNKYFKPTPWSIIEEGFSVDNLHSSERFFSLANGKMVLRADFEERYTGKSVLGSYIAGVYNSPNYIGIDVFIDAHMLNLFICNVHSFRRELNMKEGYLLRTFEAELPDGKIVRVQSQRFLSIVDTDCAVVRYSIVPVNFSGPLSLLPYIDAGVVNPDSNFDESPWNVLSMEVHSNEASLLVQTKNRDFQVATSMRTKIFIDGELCPDIRPELMRKEAWVGNRMKVCVKQGQTLSIEKYVGVCSSLHYPSEILCAQSLKQAKQAEKKGFEIMLEEQSNAWNTKWKQSDIQIEGDLIAQQSARLGIFQLHQTYTGEDAHLIAASNESCVPFFLMTTPKDVTRRLLIYYYRHLERAIVNATDSGFSGGAALYKNVSVNGNIAFAIHNYIRHTLDYTFLDQYGLEVLIAIARFWAQRISPEIKDSWYITRLACWCLSYTEECIGIVKRNTPSAWSRIKSKVNFDESNEFAAWNAIVSGNSCHLNGIFDASQEQLDTLQGIYLFENELDTDTITRYFDFYESRTDVSPCILSVLASRLGKPNKAYEMCLRTSLLESDAASSGIGTWMSVVEGFGGKRVYEGRLYLNPIIPEQWQSYTFRITFSGHDVVVNTTQSHTSITQYGNGELKLSLYGKDVIINSGEEFQVEI